MKLALQQEEPSKDEEFFAKLRKALKDLNQELADGKIKREEFEVKLKLLQQEFERDEGDSK